MTMRQVSLLMMSLYFVSCASPTSPDPRTGVMALRAVCDDSGSSPLICVAQTYCAGLYRCPDPAGDNADVSSRAEWTVEHPSIVHLGAQPNWFVAASPGDTVIRVRYDAIQQEATVRVSVFPTVPAPMLTAEVWGRITEAGTSPATGIRAARIELTGALTGTRTAISGSAPSLVPGYVFVLRGEDGYQFFGIPRGTYQLTVSADGYAPQTQTVTVVPPGSPMVSFQLTPLN